MNFEKIMNNENESNPLGNNSEEFSKENLDVDRVLSDKERIQELKKELEMLISWSQIDAQPNDYKRIDEVRSKIQQLESENFKETVEGTGIDLDFVDISAARYRISLDAELFELYKKSKEVVYSMTPDEGPMIKRKDVIIEMLLLLKDKEDSKSQDLLNRLVKILKESHL